MLDKNPKVSVVLPTYNGARFIRQSIDSVLRQTLDSLELIIVNDCSTDETAEILAEYDDPRVRIIVNQFNMGLPESLNVGFRSSRGSFLTWTSDDNWYDVTAFAKMLEHFEFDKELGLVYAGYYLVDENGVVTGQKKPRPMGEFTSKPWNPIGACFLYHREVYEKIGDYDPQKWLIEDYDYWLRVADQFKIVRISDPLYYYREHGSSLTGQHSYLVAKKALKLLRSRGDLSYANYRRWMGWLYKDKAYGAWKIDNNRQKAFLFANRSLFYQPHYIFHRPIFYTLVWSLLGDDFYNLLLEAKKQIT